MEAIRIIITGGTFDKQYDELDGTLTFKDTHLPEIISRARVTVPVELEISQLVDSLDMDSAGRVSILESCRVAREKRIVIIHGTDTMTDTARLIGEANIDKRVVLTGAMIPYAVANSDAVFNLGTAIATVQLIPPGVHISMNGQIFPWTDVRKNRELGLFERALSASS